MVVSTTSGNILWSGIQYISLRCPADELPSGMKAKTKHIKSRQFKMNRSNLLLKETRTLSDASLVSTPIIGHQVHLSAWQYLTETRRHRIQKVFDVHNKTKLIEISVPLGIDGP